MIRTFIKDFCTLSLILGLAFIALPLFNVMIGAGQ
jgi:hypothetical protein